METAGRRALLVNDDLFFSGRLVSVLARLGYLVNVVPSAEAALESAGKGAADLVIVKSHAVELVDLSGDGAVGVVAVADDDERAGDAARDDRLE